MNIRRFSLPMLVALVAFATTAAGNGIIVPTTPEARVSGEWAVTRHHVDIRVRHQVTEVSIEQVFLNTGSRSNLQVEYLFPVPQHAAIDSLTLIVDGQEFTAQLYQAEEARRIYEGIVRRQQDPALLEYVGQGLYKTSAFPLEPGKPVTVLITYRDLAVRSHDRVQVTYPLNAEKFSARQVQSLRVAVDIQADADISGVYSPSHDVKTERRGPRHMIATYEAQNAASQADFQLFYTSSNEAIGATFLTHQPKADEDGYFLMLVSPNPQDGQQRVVPKDVVIVLDHSGSMGTEKMRQAREGVLHVLNNLNPEDRFNIVPFESSVRTLFGETLVNATPENVRQARQQVDAIRARGGTAIHGALEMAVKILNSDPKDGRPQYILFLTDGQANVGPRTNEAIISVLPEGGESSIRIFSFGVGYDVNTALLEGLAQRVGGRNEYVRPNDQVEEAIASLYNRIRNPVMTDLSMAVRGARRVTFTTRDTYPQKIDDLFDGDQIVLVGRYERAGRGSTDSPRPATLVIKGNYLGEERTFEYPIEFRPVGVDLRYEFIEKLWAVRRVGWLLSEIQRNGQDRELIDEIVRLSRDYGIMTPYTSFLADDTGTVASPTAARERMQETLARQDVSAVAGGDAQRHAVNVSEMRSAERAPSAPRPIAPMDADGMRMARYSTAVSGAASMDDYEAAPRGEVAGQLQVANLRQVGNQALYQRAGNQWYTPEAANVDVQQAQRVARFSEEYFELVRQNNEAENLILGSQQDGEELLIVLRNQAYLIH